MLEHQRRSIQKKSRNPELSGGTGLPKQPKGVSGTVPAPSWNDMRIQYSSNNLQGAGAVADPRTAALTDPGTTTVADLGTAAVADPGTTAVADPGTTAVTEPGTAAMADLGTAAPVVQMIRKRVKGIADAFAATDIYYDKRDNRYYNGMTSEGVGEVTVSQDEKNEFHKLSSNQKRTSKTTILAEAHKGADRKFIKDIPEQEEKAGEHQSAEEAREHQRAEEAVEDQRAGEAVEDQRAGEASAADITVTGDIFSEGSVLATEPKTVRLYAEGNMRHAVSLARAFKEPEKYNQFINMDEHMNLAGNNNLTPEVLIKATEYDILEEVQRRYNENRRDNGHRNNSRWDNDHRNNDNILGRVQTAEGLEASFGGSTGDMTRPAGAHPKRLYDIIQATFFWMPKANNDQNFNKLKSFMINKRAKLKAGGKIRIVLANKGTNEHQTRNQYRLTANALTEDVDLKTLYTMRILELQEPESQEPDKKLQTYADRLTQMGMNTENFQHTRTENSKKVKAPGDLLIEATPRD